MTYTVSYWGSHPDAGNDDCYTALEFEGPEAALDQYLSDDNPLAVYPSFMQSCCAFIEIDGPVVSGIRQNPLYSSKAARRERAHDEAEWQSEIRWQARFGGLEAGDSP